MQLEPGTGPGMQCMVAEQLSVIIPALNEEQNIAAAISSVHAGLQGCPNPPEVIVVDGGSHDGTAAVARRAGCKVIKSERGRGRQLNAGWQASQRPWCMFLHADSRLPAGYLTALAPVMLPHSSTHASCNQQTRSPAWQWWAQPHHTSLACQQQGCQHDARTDQQQQHVAQDDEGGRRAGYRHPLLQLFFHRQHGPAMWGCFETIHTEWHDSWRGKLLAAGVELRTRVLGQPYGDQALFASRDLLQQVGGLPGWRLLEDVELVKRLRKASKRAPYIVPMALQTSGRRWDTLGFWQTALLNQAVLIAWSCGVAPDDLAAWYYSAKASTGQKPPPAN